MYGWDACLSNGFADDYPGEIVRCLGFSTARYGALLGGDAVH